MSAETQVVIEVDHYELAMACLKHAGAEHVRGDLCAVLLSKALVHSVLSLVDEIREHRP